MCCPKMKYDIWCCQHIILFEFSAVDKLCGFGLVMYVNVCYVWCCSQKRKIFCAVKKTYCFSLVLPGNQIVNFWCCNPISNIFGAVKKTSYLILVLLMNFIVSIWCYHIILFYKVLLLNSGNATQCCSEILFALFGAVNEKNL